jgi:hypothetical protein
MISTIPIGPYNICRRYGFLRLFEMVLIKSLETSFGAGLIQGTVLIL